MRSTVFLDLDYQSRLPYKAILNALHFPRLPFHLSQCTDPFPKIKILPLIWESRRPRRHIADLVLHTHSETSQSRESALAVGALNSSFPFRSKCASSHSHLHLCRPPTPTPTLNLETCFLSLPFFGSDLYALYNLSGWGQR